MGFIGLLVAIIKIRPRAMLRVSRKRKSAGTWFAMVVRAPARTAQEKGPKRSLIPQFILLPMFLPKTGNQWAHGKCSSRTPIFPQEASGFIVQKAPQILSYTVPRQKSGKG